MATLQQQTTQLEFHQAMADFKTMFPDMDDEVIEAVLRANQGAVDATIDQLLAMSTDNENEKLRNEMEKKETLRTTDSPKDTISERKTKSPETTTLIDTSTPDSELLPLKTIKGWSPPMLGPLPDDFLRISPTPWGGTHKKQVYLLYSYEKIKLNFII